MEMHSDSDWLNAVRLEGQHVRDLKKLAWQLHSPRLTRERWQGIIGKLLGRLDCLGRLVDMVERDVAAGKLDEEFARTLLATIAPLADAVRDMIDAAKAREPSAD